MRLMRAVQTVAAMSAAVGCSSLADPQVTRIRTHDTPERAPMSTPAPSGSWDVVPSGDGWQCFESFSYSDHRDRMSQCGRMPVQCDEQRSRLLERLAAHGATDTYVGACEPHLRAACFSFTWRLYGKADFWCASDFDDCEGLRATFSASQDMDDVTPACRAF